MKKNLSNSERISENHMPGINRVVKLDIVIEGKSISHFKHFRLQQSARTHHHFKLTLAHDSLDEVQNHNLEEARQFLGKRITVTFKYKDYEGKSPERTFVGVITQVAFSQKQMSLGNIVLEGYSPTILMDSTPHTQSFGGNQSVNTSIIADRIIKESLGTSKFDYRIETQNKGYINYSAQYCETHYNYLARLAEAYGEQFYYDGYILHFGKLPSSEKPIQLIYGSNVTDIKVELKAIHTKPEYFGYNSSSHAKMLGSDNKIKHLGDLSQKAYELNDGIFKTRSLIPTPINANMFLDVDDSQKSARGSKAVEVFTVSGNTTVPFLFIGCVADIDMRNQDSNQTSHFTTLMMTEIRHEVDARGYYTGSFIYFFTFIFVGCQAQQNDRILVMKKLSNDQKSFEQYTFYGFSNCLDESLHLKTFDENYTSTFNNLEPFPRLFEKEDILKSIKKFQTPYNFQLKNLSKEMKNGYLIVGKCTEIYTVKNIKLKTSYLELVKKIEEYKVENDSDLKNYMKDYLKYYFVKIQTE
ncbi:contractile injection system protein, VgrG/Pvc8 family [Chryseobacterium sp. JK1]|uniref:contractile injection system protein, VgrG/Pvc8 family n=1 Tax=Chryseobacterium sp. JK1 TaxID=874294 RepID=UPI003D69AA26